MIKIKSNVSNQDVQRRVLKKFLRITKIHLFATNKYVFVLKYAFIYDKEI